jgi:hypothetical protein
VIGRIRSRYLGVLSAIAVYNNIAEIVSFTLVAEDEEVAIETLAVLSRRRIPT